MKLISFCTSYFIAYKREMSKFLLGEPKFGIAYLKIYEIRQNLSLRKKFMQFCWKYLKLRIVMLT